MENNSAKIPVGKPKIALVAPAHAIRVNDFESPAETIVIIAYDGDSVPAEIRAAKGVVNGIDPSELIEAAIDAHANHDRQALEQRRLYLLSARHWAPICRLVLRRFPCGGVCWLGQEIPAVVGHGLQSGRAFVHNKLQCVEDMGATVGASVDLIVNPCWAEDCCAPETPSFFKALLKGFQGVANRPADAAILHPLMARWREVG